MTTCPDCSGKLGEGATQCRCGWGKPMLPLAKATLPPWHVQCADDEACRLPGRIWFNGMDRKARVCVDHACTRYARGEKDGLLQ